MRFVFTLLLPGVFLIGLLVGCSKSNDNANKDQGAGSGTTKQNDSNPTAPGGAKRNRLRPPE